MTELLTLCFAVALLAEGVDRNPVRKKEKQIKAVALLAEGVDRNPCSAARLNQLMKVALLAEGVDRNPTLEVGSAMLRVALLAEGVDRNLERLPRRQRNEGRPPRGGRG